MRFAAPLAFAMISVNLILAAAPEAPLEKPKVLPDVVVGANVPLVKVADYHLREARFAPAAVTAGDFIYVIGGSNESNRTLDSIERFNPKTGTSEVFAKLHTGRYWHSAVAIGNTLYVLGGRVQSIANTQIRDVPLNRRDGAVVPFAALQDMVDLSEGAVAEGFEETSSVETIDLTTGKASRLPDLPHAARSFGCVALEKKIYVIGGQQVRGDRSAFVNGMEIFDTVTGKWSEGAPMPGAREAIATVVTGGFIVAPGGYNGTRELDSVAVFNPHRQFWSEIAPLCQPTSAASLAFLGHYLFLFGDYTAPSEIVAYDLLAKTSEAFTLRYKNARHTAAAVYGDKIFVFGGKFTRESNALDYVQVFALAPKAPALSAPRDRATGAP